MKKIERKIPVIFVIKYWATQGILVYRNVTAISYEDWNGSELINLDKYQTIHSKDFVESYEEACAVITNRSSKKLMSLQKQIDNVMTIHDLAKNNKLPLNE